MMVFICKQRSYSNPMYAEVTSKGINLMTHMQIPLRISEFCGDSAALHFRVLDAWASATHAPHALPRHTNALRSRLLELLRTHTAFDSVEVFTC